MKDLSTYRVECLGLFEISMSISYQAKDFGPHRFFYTFEPSLPTLSFDTNLDNFVWVHQG